MIKNDVLMHSLFGCSLSKSPWQPVEVVAHRTSSHVTRKLLKYSLPAMAMAMAMALSSVALASAKSSTYVDGYRHGLPCECV